MAYLLFTFTQSTQTYISVGSDAYTYARVQIAAGASACTGAPHASAERDAGRGVHCQAVSPSTPVCGARGVPPLPSPVALIQISCQADSCDVRL